MTELQLDILCVIKYLTDDRRSRVLPSSTNIGIFLRASDQSKSKAFMHKYDIYGKYHNITNDEISELLEDLANKKYISSNNSLTEKGLGIIAEKRPNAMKNPYELANDAIANGEEYYYIGQYACYYRLDVFRKKSLNEVLDRLEGFNAKVSPYPIEPEQIRAWTDTYNVLQKSFKELPTKYNELYVIFEYVLPTHKPGSKRSENDNGIRADVVLVSKTATMVLEFKQRNNDFEGFVSQAQKYTTRLSRFHAQAMHMKNYTALVLTKADKYLKRHETVTSCSKDYLADILQIVFDNDCERLEDIKSWLNAKFITE